MAIRGYLGLSQQSEAQLLENKTAMAMRLADPDFDPESQVFNPIKQKMSSEKEVFVDVKEMLDKQLEEMEAERKVCQEIMAESEKRAKALENSPTRQEEL